MWQWLKYTGELQNYLLADKTKTFYTPLQCYIVQFCGKFAHVLMNLMNLLQAVLPPQNKYSCYDAEF